MYNPKKVFTKDGYNLYMAHLKNIEEALIYINNHDDDLHIGALSTKQETNWYVFNRTWHELKDILKTGDGETD